MPETRVAPTLSAQAWADGPDRSPLLVTDPQWWRQLFTSLAWNRTTPQTVDPEPCLAWIRWLAQPAVGPQGEAVSWELFRVGLELWTEQPCTNAARSALAQWLAWHGSGRIAQDRGVVWGAQAPAPWAVWAEAAPASQPALVTRLLAWHRSASDSSVAPRAMLQAVVGAVPIEALGLMQTTWAPLVRLLLTTRPGAGAEDRGAWASAETIAALGITGQWRTWLNEFVDPPASHHPPEFIHRERARVRREFAEHALLALGERADWPEDALAELWAAMGPKMFRVLGSQTVWPTRWMEAALTQMDTPDEADHDGYTLRDAVGVFLQCVPVEQRVRPGSGATRLAPEAAHLLNHSLRTCFAQERRAYEQPLGAGGHAEQFGFRQALAALPAVPALVDALETPVLALWLASPDKAVREAGLRLLGVKGRPAAMHRETAPGSLTGSAR